MLLARPHFAFILAVGLLAAAMSSNLLLADDAALQAEEHDHAAMTEKKIADALVKLSPGDRKLAEAQRFCPVMEYGRLGAMGAPIKVTVEGTPVLLCCKGCVEDAVAGGKKTLEKVTKLTAASAVLTKLSPEDRTAAEAQKYCAIAEGSFLGSMGAPIKLMMEGKPVFLCCKGCVAKAQANPAATLAKVDALKKAGTDDVHGDVHEHAEHKN